MTLDVTSVRAASAPREPKPKAKSAIKSAPQPSLVIVRRSPIQGRGVFAAKDIARGTRILEYTGDRISADEADDIYDDETSSRHHTFLFSVNDEIIIDATRRGNEARFINHCCDPNCCAMLDESGKVGRVYILAKRDITRGEELSYDYWYTTVARYTNDDLKRMYPCHCGAKGAKKCRGTLAAPRRKKRAVRAAAKRKAG